MTLEDEAACARLCVDFVNHIDARRYEPLLDLYTEDGTLDRMSTLLTGRQEIARFLASRPAEVATRHMCTNIRVGFDADDQASGFCHVLFFQGSGADAVSVMSGGPSVVEYHDRYVRTQAGCESRPGAFTCRCAPERGGDADRRARSATSS